MKKIMRGALLALLILTMCLSLMCPAFAADAITVEIPVKVTASGDVPTEKETYTFTLTADNASNPMPEGTVDGVYTMEVEGPGEYKFPAISFSTHGVYNYTVTQKAGSNELCDYDDTVYHVTVYITNKEDYSGLQATVAVYVDGVDEKQDIEFDNEYDKPCDPPKPCPPPECDLTWITVHKIWKGEGPHPEYVKVKLLCNGRPVTSVYLSELTNWTWTWAGLDDDFYWSVEEVVPEGYEADYYILGNLTVIVNTQIPEPEDPDVPDEPDDPVVPPVDPPVDPEDPDDPIVPPVDPEDPDEPDDPIVPPVDPEDPDEPDDPDVPPVDPEDPDEPDVPNEPDKPVDPDEPENPDKPESPKKPEPTKKPDKLIQTGQLNWPIVVGVVLGILVIAAGLLLIFKKKQEGNDAA